MSCIQSLLVNNDVSGVLLRLHNLDKKEQLLVLESAKLVEIRKILSHLKLPLLSDSKASKVSRLHKHLQSDLEQGKAYGLLTLKYLWAVLVSGDPSYTGCCVIAGVHLSGTRTTLRSCWCCSLPRSAAGRSNSPQNLGLGD